MRARVFLQLAVFIAVAISQTSCFLAPAMDSFSKIGVTEGDRQRLLAERLRNFKDALYWSEPGEALTFVVPENRVAMEPVFRRIRKEEKIVDSRTESVAFSDSGYKADVEVTFKYYRVPYYVVTERTEAQTWQFSIADGWLLASRSEKKTG